MIVTVLSDNVGTNALKGEWGLSFYIQHGDRTILLDTGASGRFVENAETLGLPLAAVDTAVLSHAHYDHADGMRPFFAANATAPFYLQRAAQENAYARYFVFHRYIGLPKGILRDFSDRIVPVDGRFDLGDGMTLLPHSTPGLSAIGKAEHMVLRDRSGWRPDDFAHEQSLIFDTPEGLVIFNSCSHGGADTILKEAAVAFPDRPLKALIGGFHLYNKSEETVRALGRRLRDTGVRAVYTGHCTGQKAFGVLREELGETLHAFHTGLVLSL